MKRTLIHNFYVCSWRHILAALRRSTSPNMQLHGVCKPVLILDISINVCGCIYNRQPRHYCVLSRITCIIVLIHKIPSWFQNRFCIALHGVTGYLRRNFSADPPKSYSPKTSHASGRGSQGLGQSLGHASNMFNISIGNGHSHGGNETADALVQMLVDEERRLRF